MERNGTERLRGKTTTEGNLPGLHQTYLHVRSKLPGAPFAVKLGPGCLLRMEHPINLQQQQPQQQLPELLLSLMGTIKPFYCYGRVA
uniref:Uncharacterized protein n=1 Tax=Leersia perrieri TaxID=77586 RepID=A0A0D9W4W4_9ORYZ